MAEMFAGASILLVGILVGFVFAVGIAASVRDKEE